MRLIRILGFGVFLTVLSYVLFSFFWIQDSSQEKIRVYTYSSFASSWGPGGELAKKFYERFGVRVHFVDVGDAGLLVERVKVDTAQSKVDVVLGLDQLLQPEARKEIDWKSVNLSQFRWAKDFKEFSLISGQNHIFVPFDWAPLSFVARRSEGLSEITDFQGLLVEELKSKIGIQDPRTSTPGLQFLFWVLATQGEEEGFEYLRQLFKQLHSVSPSWGKSYGLYQKGHLKTVLSYLTSPVYHWQEDRKRDHYPIVFPEGHIVQVEYVAIPEKTTKPHLAEKFVHYLLSKEAQKIIMEKNFMFPVIARVRQRTLFQDLPRVQFVGKDRVDELLARKKELVKRWAQIRRNYE